MEIGGTNSLYRILQVTCTLLNTLDNCLSVYIVSIEAFCATVKLKLFMLILVCLTKNARTALHITTGSPSLIYEKLNFLLTSVLTRNLHDLQYKERNRAKNCKKLLLNFINIAYLNSVVLLLCSVWFSSNLLHFHHVKLHRSLTLHIF